ncbi:archaeosortase/exosortase family protein [bacterium]|nr:archaeosortase/exosortase family protein [bacterium]
MLVVFAAIEFTFFYFLPYIKPVNEFIQAKTALVVFSILSLFGVEGVIVGDVIYLANISLKVVYECTGGFAFFIFSSCVLAYPSNAIKKIIGHLIGAVGIFAINIIRLVLIAWVGIYSKQAFDFIHKYLWQGTFIIFVLLLWVIWVDKVVKD